MIIEDEWKETMLQLKQLIEELRDKNAWLTKEVREVRAERDFWHKMATQRSIIN